MIYVGINVSNTLNYFIFELIDFQCLSLFLPICLLVEKALGWYFWNSSKKDITAVG